jgi:hypothetical protein
VAISYAVGVNSPTNLWQLIQNYTESTESTFVANIPTFVVQAEQRIYNSVQLPAARKNVTANCTANNKYLTLPADWLAAFSVAVIEPVTNAQSYLINKDVSFIRSSYPDPDTAAAPVHYALFDNDTFILGPTPDQSYGIEMHYFGYPDSITTAGTTWLGTNFETVLLYGSLREAYLYLKGEQDITAYYEQKYQEGLALLKNLAEGKEMRDSYRSGNPRIGMMGS